MARNYVNKIEAGLHIDRILLKKSSLEMLIAIVKNSNLKEMQDIIDASDDVEEDK